MDWGLRHPTWGRSTELSFLTPRRNSGSAEGWSAGGVPTGDRQSREAPVYHLPPGLFHQKRLPEAGGYMAQARSLPERDHFHSSRKPAQSLRHHVHTPSGQPSGPGQGLLRACTAQSHYVGSVKWEIHCQGPASRKRLTMSAKRSHGLGRNPIKDSAKISVLSPCDLKQRLPCRLCRIITWNPTPDRSYDCSSIFI